MWQIAFQKIKAFKLKKKKFFVNVDNKEREPGKESTTDNVVECKSIIR